MITVYSADEYGKIEELRKAHTRWLEDSHTINVLATMEIGSRAHLVQTKGMSTEDKLVELGRIQGMQFVIDKIRSLDAPYRPAIMPQENFDVPPVK
jgi:hypothetical protein